MQNRTDISEIGFLINYHYLHDLSIENPIGHIKAEDVQKLALGHDGKISSKKLDLPDTYEVDITLTLSAAVEGRVIFIAELTYRVSATLQNIPPPVVSHVLAVEIPTAMLPLMTDILKQNAAYSSYRELEIGGLDFRAIFNKKYQFDPTELMH